MTKTFHFVYNSYIYWLMYSVKLLRYQLCKASYIFVRYKMWCILFYMILFSCLSNGIYHLGGLMLSLLCLIAVRFRALTSGSIVKISHSDLLYKVVIFWSLIKLSQTVTVLRVQNVVYCEILLHKYGWVL